MSRIHTADVKARIEAVSLLASKTFVVLVKYPAPNEQTIVKAPYAAIYPANGTNTQARLTGPKLTQHPSWTVHIVGATVDMTTRLIEDVEAQFILGGFGIRPDIAGENPGRYEWSQPIPIQYDSDVSPPLIYAVVEIDFYTEPA